MIIFIFAFIFSVVFVHGLMDSLRGASMAPDFPGAQLNQNSLVGGFVLQQQQNSVPFSEQASITASGLVLLQGYLAKIDWFSSTTCTGTPMFELIGLNICIPTPGAAGPFVKYIKLNATYGAGTYYSDSKCMKALTQGHVVIPSIECAPSGSTSSVSFIYFATYTDALTKMHSLIPHGFGYGQFASAGQCNANTGAGFMVGFVYPLNVCFSGTYVRACTSSTFSINTYANATTCTGKVTYKAPQLAPICSSKNPGTIATYTGAMCF